MRVAMVSEHASPLAVLGGVDAGGQNVYVAALSQELGRRGVEVVVHTRRDDPDIPRRFELAPRVTVDHVDAGPPERIPNPIDTLLPFMDEFARDLRSQWERDRPDVVHSHFWMSGRAALAAAGPLGVPVVHTFHALGVVKRRHQGVKDTSPPERIPEERAIIARAERILATCSDEVFELVRLGADQRRISVVPCGVNLSLFRPDGPVAPRTHGLHRIVCVTRLVERKGVGNVVAALAEVPETELVIAGGPAPEELATDPEYRRLIELAGQVGVADRVRFTGRLERGDVPPLVRSADVVACVPWYEPFGIVPLEAMACGVPVVGSAVGGLLDTVVHGVTGLHVPPRRPDKIGEAVRELLADPARRAAYGRAGTERARARYGWERVADSALGIYAEVAAAAPAAREAAW
ncbi:MAG TPA: glycosyltransferase [Gaiellaceae bacterium]|nr:glycosyltransferase [Gaiellaceae bacterium]